MSAFYPFRTLAVAPVSPIVCYGLLRSDQTSADTLEMTAARPSKAGGSNMSMTRLLLITARMQRSL